MPTSAESTTVQEHLRELQTLVQDSLRQWNLASDSTTATTLAAQNNPDRLPHELHPLGPVQVGTLQRDFKEKIAAIRAICLSFAQGPLQQSLNGGDTSSAPAFRKYSTLLKDETQLEEALSSVKASMTQCQNTLRAASQDGNIKKDHLISTIWDMATKLGLECYLETGSRPNSLLPVSTLTIGGNVIVVDIDVESTGAILRVKVSYASEIHQDERIDRLLAHNLRCKCGKLLQTVQEKGRASEVGLVHLPDCSRDFDAFSKNLKALATLDSFSKKYPNVDFFHNIRSVGADFKELFKREMQITGRDLERVFRQGHGIPMSHAVLIGPSIAYWASKSDLLEESWESLSSAIEQGANDRVKIPFHRISITMEESTNSITGYLPVERSGYLLSEEETLSLTSVPYGTIMNDQRSVSATTVLQQPLKWIVPTTDATVEAIYVAILHPPVVVSEDVATQLAALSNQAGLNITLGFHKDPGYLSLQEQLIRPSNEQTQWEIVLDQDANSVRQLYSFDRTKNEARTLYRIPFTHVSQVYICTKLLRQQMAFNALFQSCFKETKDDIRKLATINAGSNENAALEVSIVVQTPKPPSMILVSFLNPFTETNMMLEILIGAGTGIATARLVNGGATVDGSIHSSNIHSGSNDQFVVGGEKLTKVLQTCENIPILVRWVLRQSFAWVKERHQHQLKGHPHPARRASSFLEDSGILKRPRDQVYDYYTKGFTKFT
ncbi:hypothetical protein BGZ50_002578 [Haplosporangium sp. Z 11]|nr:hypothetical protein BGZ50_002578 [Haplosporangium sp. Z 11]